MKNYEYYKYELEKAINDCEICDMIQKRQKKKVCGNGKCYYCMQLFMKWLGKEKEEEITLSKCEFVLLKGLKKRGYNYIKRHYSIAENEYCIFVSKDPYSTYEHKRNGLVRVEYEYLCYGFEKIFMFIDVGAEYSIDELLKYEVVENENDKIEQKWDVERLVSLEEYYVAKLLSETKYKYIVRKKGGWLYIYSNEPLCFDFDGDWETPNFRYPYKGYSIYNDLFNFITWEDKTVCKAIDYLHWVVPKSEEM